jgi:hypothetical protein
MHTIPENIPFDKKVEIIKYNIMAKKRFINNLERNYGNFKLIMAKNKHLEAPNQLDIINSNGEPIGSINFYFTIKNNKSEMIINLIQGVVGKEKDLTEFSTKFKQNENWRTFFIKGLKRWCDAHNINLIGQLPERFFYYGQGMNSPTVSENEYRRQIRQYLQTYLQSGIALENIDLTNIDNKHKDWLIKNLRIKQERLEGKRPPQRTEPKRRAKILAKKPMA